MKHYKSNAELKNLAKDKLTGNFSNALFALMWVRILTGTVTNMAVSMIPTGGIIWDVVSILFTAIASVFLGILQTGVAFYFLNVACGRHAIQSNIFYGFQEASNKSIKISLVHVLAETVCMLPYQIFFMLFMHTFNSKYLITALVALLIGYIVLTPIKLMISQTYYLLLDFPEDTPENIIKSSIRIMKGHKWRLFLLDLSFLPLYLLCMLTLGIGLLWLNPYMQMTYTLFFLDLMNPGSTDHNTSNNGYAV